MLKQEKIKRLLGYINPLTLLAIVSLGVVIHGLVFSRDQGTAGLMAFYFIPLGTLLPLLFNFLINFGTKDLRKRLLLQFVIIGVYLFLIVKGR